MDKAPAATGGTVAATGGTVAPTGGTITTDGGDVIDGGTATDARAVDAQLPDTKVDPLHAAPTCTSKATWNGSEGPTMAPGQACIACHAASGDAPNYTIAGTLYPTGHEPDNCNGASGSASGAKIVLTGANGKVLTLTPNSAGNFYSIEQVATPYTVKVVDGKGVERIMMTSASSGDCNACHTQMGAGGATGRVTLP